MRIWKLTYMKHGSISDFTGPGETLADAMRPRHLVPEQIIGVISRLTGVFGRPVIRQQRDQAIRSQS